MLRISFTVAPQAILIISLVPLFVFFVDLNLSLLGTNYVDQARLEFTDLCLHSAGCMPPHMAWGNDILILRRAIEKDTRYPALALTCLRKNIHTYTVPQITNTVSFISTVSFSGRPGFLDYDLHVCLLPAFVLLNEIKSRE